MANNKIKYGIRNCYYATRTESTTTAGTYIYGSPVKIPGAVSLSLAPEGEQNSFYADDTEYFRTDANNGYSGDFELAVIPDAFRQYALGETLDSNNVLIEDSDAQGGEFALAFEVQGDEQPILFWFYNCVVSRPNQDAQTKEASITPQTETINIACRPDEDYNVRARSTDAVSTATRTAWFNTVYKTS